MTTEHRAEIRFYTLKTALKKFHVNRNSEKGRYHYTGKIKEKPATCTIYKGGYAQRIEDVEQFMNKAVTINNVDIGYIDIHITADYPEIYRRYGYKVELT